MNLSVIADELNAVVPGVVEAYTSLYAENGMGIYTSSGTFYNHTIFGRDASMSAKFVADFDHAVTRDTIMALASLQGTAFNKKSQEEPGRIHHELRDFARWRGDIWERIGFVLLDKAWGIKNQKLLSYFSLDSTCDYIRLVHKYATHIDRSVLARSVIDARGKRVSIAQSVENAANWIVSHVDENGLFCSVRTNRWSIPYQTFQDSVTAYAWQDKKAVNYKKPHAFVETQAFAIDALMDAAHLLEGEGCAQEWRAVIESMQDALFRDFWLPEDQFFSGVVSDRDGRLQPAPIRNITAGWILNTILWKTVAEDKRGDMITAIVKRLFSDEFLTPVGLRTRSKNQPEPLGDTIDYHGSRAVWPMFTFFVAEGLRKHNLFRLADQLENRLCNGCNATGDYQEYFIVEHDGTVVIPRQDKTLPSLDVQMIPERKIAFTVVPMMTLAYRSSYNLNETEQEPWQAQLEDYIMHAVPLVERYKPEEARRRVAPVPRRLVRKKALRKTTWYMLKNEMRLGG